MAQKLQTAAKRLKGIDTPSIWTVLATLAGETKATNLGQGFPNWGPPDFYTQALKKYADQSYHQYTRAYGIPRLVETVAKHYSPIFKQKLDPMLNICISTGGVGCLFSAYMGLLDKGDEVILLDPSYDVYYGQIQLASAKIKSVPLKPKKIQSKQEILKRAPGDQFRALESDRWEVDLKGIEKAMSPKTKLLVINSPNNPTGKVYTREELEAIASIVKKHPQCMVLEDGVYEHISYEKYKPLELPRMAQIPGMWDRTVSFYSNGKHFSCTGVRFGYLIGPQPIINSCRSVHQFFQFCNYQPTSEAIADSIEHGFTTNYFQELNDKYKHLRQVLLQQLYDSKLDLNLWIPEGGYFVISDVSNIKVPDKYFLDAQGKKLSKDMAFVFWLAREKGVITVPCTSFYDEKKKAHGQNFVRWAFCKDESILLEAGKKLQI